MLPTSFCGHMCRHFLVQVFYHPPSGGAMFLVALYVGRLKMQDWKMTDQVAGALDNARSEK